MKTVFECAGFGEKPGVEAAIVDALHRKEWVSTWGMYRATGANVKREVLHQTLRDLLKQKRIRMRVLGGIGRPRTEFKLNDERGSGNEYD